MLRSSIALARRPPPALSAPLSTSSQLRFRLPIDQPTIDPPPHAAARGLASSSRSGSRGGGGSPRSGGGRGGAPDGPGAGPRKVPFKPPPIKPNSASGDVDLERVARARKLHEEIQSLVDAQATRQAEEMKRPFGAGFLKFLKNSRLEAINIFAAFACVVLAYQIAAMRRGARDLLERAEKREREVAELREVLRSLTDEGFARDAGKNCAGAVREEWGGGIRRGGVGALLGWGANAPSSEEEEKERDNIAEAIRPVLLREIRAVVGDSHLSDEEKENKRLQDLKRAMGLRKETLGEGRVNAIGNSGDEVVEGTFPKGADGSLGGLEEVLAETQKGEVEARTGDEVGVVKKRIKYAI